MRRHGRARVSATSPAAFAICDRCGALYNRRSLIRQHDYRGDSYPQNRRILVCDTCLDEPQQQLRAFRVAPDPRPIRNPRPSNILEDLVYAPGVGAATWAGYAPSYSLSNDDIFWGLDVLSWGGGVNNDLLWGPAT